MRLRSGQAPPPLRIPLLPQRKQGLCGREAEGGEGRGDGGEGLVGIEGRAETWKQEIGPAEAVQGLISAQGAHEHEPTEPA